MDKKIIFFTLTLALTLTFPLFAEDETFTITTYYPSPYGSYNELATNKFVVGYTSSDEQPNTAGAIRLKAQPGVPTTWARGKEGEIAYSSVEDTLYVSNGSTWVAQGGSVVIYSPKCSWNCERGTYGSCSCTSTCTPPSCASDYTDLGVGCTSQGGGASTSGTYAGWVVCNGYGYCERYCAKQ